MRSELRGKTAEARGLREQAELAPRRAGTSSAFPRGLNDFVVQLRRSATICGASLHGLRGLRPLACPVCSGQTGRAEAPPHPVRVQRTIPSGAPLRATRYPLRTPRYFGCGYAALCPLFSPVVRPGFHRCRSVYIGGSTLSAVRLRLSAFISVHQRLPLRTAFARFCRPLAAPNRKEVVHCNST